MKRIGIFIDYENVRLNGGYSMNIHIIRKIANYAGANLMLGRVYMGFDKERWNTDMKFRNDRQSYMNALASFGFDVVDIEIQKYVDTTSKTSRIKANADVELSWDVAMSKDKLDMIIIVTGDGDFNYMVEDLHGSHNSKLVQVIGFNNVSAKYLESPFHDLYISGYLIPDLIQFDKELSKISGNWYRGIVVNQNVNEKGDRFVFLKYYTFDMVNGLVSNTAYYSCNNSPEIKSWNYKKMIYEFQLAEGKGESPTAINMREASLP